MFCKNSYLAHLLNPSSKKKKFLYFLIFQEMVLSSYNIKKFLIFFLKKLFLYFRKWRPWENSLCLRKRRAFIFQEMETPKKFFIFQEKDLSYISRGTSKTPKTNISDISPQNFMNKFFWKHFRIIVSIFSINWTKQYYWYIESFLLCWIFFQLLSIFY